MNLSTAENMRTPTDSIAAALKARLAGKIVRFVPDERPTSELARVPRQFRQCWARMELSSTHGWPLWEAEVYGLLAESFAEIHSIFSYYGRSGAAGGTSASAALTLQSSELTNLALDIELAHKNFPMVRRHPPAAPPTHPPPPTAHRHYPLHAAPRCSTSPYSTHPHTLHTPAHPSPPSPSRCAVGRRA